ncbi:MAG TPA: DUF58 domain-containing protein [Phycisphaerales bacterium]|nr:DUF58 domain-containing protein [Phycisphaerales bacterium]
MPTTDQHPAPLKRKPDELARGDFELVVRRLAEELAFGADNSLFIGGGLEYAGSRPYEPGDSVRSLNWRLTARTGRPFVKLYEALKRTCIYVVVDTSGSMAVSSTVLSKHDLAVWIASALGVIGQRRMSPVAIVGGGDRETRVEPSLARNDLWRVIEPLRVGRYGEPTRLGERLRALLARVERASVIVVISDMHDPSALPAVRLAAQSHDCIAVHLQDPSEEGRLGGGFIRAREAETGVATLIHSRARWSSADTLRSDLVRAGVDYLRLRTDLPFVPPLRHFLSSRGGLTRGRG